ncbi:MAG TPA: chemotaxis protein CheB, partial [Casimicrobiaceae bacterium]
MNPDAGKGLPQVAPDAGEREAGTRIDDVVPTYGYALPPMVGIGGSAGAFRPLQAFFENVPADTGMVFVVVMHLAPDHASVLPQMIQKWTAMPVSQAVDGEAVAANRVYVIPPGKHLTASDGLLRLAELERERGRRVAVDLFFRSLADSHGAHATAIVL